MKVAFGRDYRDVPPNKGIYRGNATESIEAVVHSELLESIPPELATDRTHQLNVPTFPGRHTPYRDQVVHQYRSSSSNSSSEAMEGGRYFAGGTARHACRVLHRRRLQTHPDPAPCGGRSLIARFYCRPGQGLGVFFGGFGEK